jgi:hypothetical protein
VPPFYGTTILGPHAPQETRPCTRAVPGRGRPRVLFRSSAACWSVRIACLWRDVSPLREGGETSGRPTRHCSCGRRVIAGRTWRASRRRVRVRPEVNAPAEAGGVSIASTAATRGACPTRAPQRSRRGSTRGCALHTSTTFLAERHGTNVSHTRDKRAWASWSGSVCPVPWRVRIRPVGRGRAHAPRSAWWRSPAVRRACLVCRAHADRVPFPPQRRRPLTVAGASMPSPSAIPQPLSPHTSQSGDQSAPWRDRRVPS